MLYTHTMIYTHSHSVIGYCVFTYKSEKFPQRHHYTPSIQTAVGRSTRHCGTPVLRCPQGTTELAVGKLTGNEIGCSRVCTTNGPKHYFTTQDTISLYRTHRYRALTP